MSIKRAADKRRKEELYALDSASGEFVPWALGDLATIDRFLSNFHKPLQRRMLHISPETEIPPSGVIRVESTNEIYLISEPRDDASDNQTYDRLCVLHHVSGKSGGLVEVFSYIKNESYPRTSIANYDKKSIGHIYLSIEYGSSKKAENSDEYYEAKFVVFAPTGTPLDKDGVFSINGDEYIILQTYIDSSFKAAVVLQQPDDMQTLTYYKLSAGSGYDVDTGELSLNEEAYLFSGTVDFHSVDEYATKKLTVYVKALDLPFKLSVGRFLADKDGRRSKITEISKDINAGGQYKLKCEGV